MKRVLTRGAACRGSRRARGWWVAAGGAGGGSRAGRGSRSCARRARAGAGTPRSRIMNGSCLYCKERETSRYFGYSIVFIISLCGGLEWAIPNLFEGVVWGVCLIREERFIMKWFCERKASNLFPLDTQKVNIATPVIAKFQTTPIKVVSLWMYVQVDSI